MAYTVHITGNPDTTHETYAEALRVAENEGAKVTSHDGDLTDGGDRTLLWASEALAENDPGTRAMGEIRRSEAYVVSVGDDAREWARHDTYAEACDEARLRAECGEPAQVWEAEAYDSHDGNRTRPLREWFAA